MNKYLPVFFVACMFWGTIGAAEPVWLSEQSVPKTMELEEPAEVRHYTIKANEPEKDGYRWLHGVALVWHKGKLYASFGHNKGSENTAGEEARGRVSSDGGKTWGEVFTIGAGTEPNLSISHGIFLSRDGELWAFHGAFYGSKLTDVANSKVHTRAYKFDEKTGTWENRGPVVREGFWPMQEPIRMADGNWIMSGVRVGDGHPAAVAISHGNDLSQWTVVPIPRSATLRIWGESSIIVDGKRVQNFARIKSQPASILTAVSEDYGRTWTESLPSNLPMVQSKPYAGTLSTGQRYLIGTTTAEAATNNFRSPLTIAVGLPGENGFRKIFRIRGSAHPENPGGSHLEAKLSYPYAVEHDGHLYIGFSSTGGRGKNNNNHNSAELAVIPIKALQVR